MPSAKPKNKNKLLNKLSINKKSKKQPKKKKQTRKRKSQLRRGLGKIWQGLKKATRQFINVAIKRPFNKFKDSKNISCPFHLVSLPGKSILKVSVFRFKSIFSLLIFSLDTVELLKYSVLIPLKITRTLLSFLRSLL